MVLMYPADRHLTLMWKYEEVRSLRIAAAFCRISKSTAQRWIKQHTTPIEKKDRDAPVLNESLPLVEAEVLSNSFVTCQTLSEKLDINREMVLALCANGRFAATVAVCTSSVSLSRRQNTTARQKTHWL